MNANFEKLPPFVGGAVDFGALASTTNFAKMPAQDGCKNVEGVKERDLEGPSDLGATFSQCKRLARNFMKSF
jgi:hypothetical protein